MNSTHNPIARSTRIFLPPVSSPSPVAVTPIATPQRLLDMIGVAPTTATGPLAKLLYLMSESIQCLSHFDPETERLPKKSWNILLTNRWRCFLMTPPML
jgi:hypothetical protein